MEIKTIGEISDDAESHAMNVIEDSPYVRLLKQQLTTRESENEKLLATLHEMTVNRRVENMIRAKELGLPFPKVNKDGSLRIQAVPGGANDGDGSAENTPSGVGESPKKRAGAKASPVPSRQSTEVKRRPKKKPTAKRSGGVLGRLFGVGAR